MNNNPIRVLHVVGTMNRGGLESLIMNLYRNIDRSKIQFDFLVHKEEIGAFESEIKALGGNIHRIDHVSKVGPYIYIKQLNNFFRINNQYKIIHSHMNAMSGIILRQAKKNNIPVRIAHSHNAYPKMGILEALYKNYSKLFINNNSTARFACSNLAAEWLYGKKSNMSDVVIINNGIELEEFKYEYKLAKNKRSELNINQDDFVVGHIGRFHIQKNHVFLIDIFQEILNINQNSKLVLVGTGNLEDKIKEKVNRLGLKDKVLFLGVRSDVNELIQVFDVVVFPSLHEGLPVTLVEAQANGLNCIISSEITKEVDLGCNLVKFVKLTEKAKLWAKEVVKVYRESIGKNREDSNEILKSNGYDIKQVIVFLENFYESEHNKNILNGYENNNFVI